EVHNLDAGLGQASNLFSCGSPGGPWIVIAIRYRIRAVGVSDNEFVRTIAVVVNFQPSWLTIVEEPASIGRKPGSNLTERCCLGKISSAGPIRPHEKQIPVA